LQYACQVQLIYNPLFLIDIIQAGGKLLQAENGKNGKPHIPCLFNRGHPSSK
jgi:hypothetical protein